MKKPWIQALTLCLFVGLITVFVGYRAGWFSEKKEGIPLSPNGSVINSQNGNKKVNKEKKEPFIMPSSKAMILPENDSEVDSVHVDSIYIPEENEMEVFPSSKSGKILDAGSLFKSEEKDSSSQQAPPK